jgi:hypothetical protein
MAGVACFDASTRNFRFDPENAEAVMQAHL